MEHLTQSNPSYEEYNRLQMMLVWVTNRQIANRYGNRESDVVAGTLMGNDGEVEIEATKQVILKEMNKRLDVMLNDDIRESYGECVEGLEL